MLISTNLNYAGDIVAAADEVARLEQAGLDVIWVAEAYGFDSVSIMGYLAARTERVQIGAGILNIYSRTPALLAQTAAGLDSVTGGRFVLGLGASGPQVIEGWHGVPYARPLARTRDIVEIARMAWRRERLEHQGTVTLPLPAGQGTGLGKPLKMITTPVRQRIPIYLAALGSKNVEMTAELAEGWLPIMYVPEKADQVWGESLRAGTSKRDPSLGTLEVVAGGLCAIGEWDEVAAIRDLARPFLALYIGGMGARGKNFYNDLARRYGYEAAATKIQDLYLDGKKDEAAAAVPDELVDLTNLVGPPGFVQERIAAFRESGVTQLSITPAVPEPLKLVATIKEWAA